MGFLEAVSKFMLPFRLRESSRGCEIGRGSIFSQYEPTYNLATAGALTLPKWQQKLTESLLGCRGAYIYFECKESQNFFLEF